jgi:hydroxymethylglutaryl-CoA synthase
MASAASRIGLARALEGAVELSREQYEALHDGAEVPGLAYTPRQEFRIARVGQSYDPAFQDLGVEYYEYVA